ncbi:MAG TPA: ureidoglycolate lyase [Patescibacteria group bacterium]|jgi:ureidoglycolate lyase|nr:ureidoglycolate lyase [Patescibacteria group bacterium]
MKPRLLKPAPLTAKEFKLYGDVIEPAQAVEVRHINYGNTDRFHDLARLDITGQEGRPLVSIFRSKPLPRPIPVKVMERHPLSSQAFYPLSNRPYMVVVAEKGEFDPKKLRAFLAAPGQGVNYHAGVWHHYSLALDDISEFLVVDRGGPEKNCDEVFLEENIQIDY